jgi:putative hydrolase of the HAD superfamily
LGGGRFERGIIQALFFTSSLQTSLWSMVMHNLDSFIQEFPIPPEVPTPKAEIGLHFEPPPRVILFDVYGTLIAPYQGDLQQQLKRAKRETESFVLTARRFGYGAEVGESWGKSFYEHIHREHAKCDELGITRAEVAVDRIWEVLIREAGGDAKKHPPRKLGLFREMAANPVAAFSGASMVLKTLKERGCRLGLASNSQYYTLPILKRLLAIVPEVFFEPQWTFLSYRLGFAKPDPHFFRLVRTQALQSGLQPEEVLVVGNDLENDVHAAMLHGLRAVLFAPGMDGGGEDEKMIDAPVIRNFESLLLYKTT